MNNNTIILGLGNPILSDDGVGCLVAAALKERLEGRGIDVLEASVAGLDFLDLLAGYDRAIIIDAIKTEGGRPGQIHRLDLEAFKNTRHSASPHDINLATALELGKRLGLSLPTSIEILAIEVVETDVFGERCTPEVEAAVPVCVEMIVEDLKGSGTAGPRDAACV